MSRSSTLSTSAASRAVDSRDTPTRVLDAAYEELARVGLQRTSMEDVARRAGVSRVTVYRHFATKAELVEQVLHREFGRLVQQYLAGLQRAETVQDRIVGGYVTTLQALRRNPLLQGLLSVELDAVVSSMAGRTDEVLAMARTFIAAQLQAEQAAGEIAAHVEVEVVADLMTRVAITYVLIPSDVVDLDDDEAAHAMIRGFLLPLLGWSS